MKYYGIDITQHKEFCITTDIVMGHFHCKTEERNPFLPAALLPEFKHEKVLMASEVGRSRKGLGLLWPREAQIPVGNNGIWKNGIGRIPLLSCLSNIKAKGEADEWNFIESTISWTPHVKQTITFSNAELLGKVFNNIKDAKQICFVIPEDFGENAQQALLEKFPQDTFLIPRSIAIAVKWCKDHQAEYQNVSFSMEQSPIIGHLVCVSLGFGEWEVSLIEIQAQKINGTVHLIPLYDPTVRNHGLSFCGIGLCKQLISNPDDIGSVWRLICNHAWFDTLLLKGLDDAVKRKLTLALLVAENSGLPYPNLDAMIGLCQKHTLRGGIKNKIISCLEQQKQRFRNARNILGVAVGGSFSKLPVLPPENEKFYDVCPSNSPFVKMSIEQLKRYASLGIYQAQRLLQYRLNLQIARHSDSWTIANFLFPDWERQKKLFIYEADVFAKGASIAAYCIEEKIPSFRIKLLPLYLYTIGRNQRGDKEEKWECLVSESMLDAGETYHQIKPITGLSIPEGKEQLELTLRRPRQSGEPLYRSVVAKIPQKTEQKESVVVSANVKPGQGFARVNIVSERHNVFSTHLDWRSMKTVSKPMLRLEYIPNVAFIISDLGLWHSAQCAIRYFIDAWETLGELKGVDALLSSLRLWYWDKNSSNIYRHLGAINNDGMTTGLLNKSLLERFQKTLLDAWKQTSDTSLKNRLLRVAGWLYLFIPKEMQKEAEQRIRWGDEKAIHLHVAGLTFHRDEHFALFYQAFCERTDHKAEWFRALRNMVRFRDNALSDDVLSNDQMSEILAQITYSLENYSIYNQRNKYNNSIEVLIYLLKRRRYDENFLMAGDESTIRLGKILHAVIENHPTEKYRKIAKETLAFLNKEATSENLTAILEANGGDYDDGGE